LGLEKRSSRAGTITISSDAATFALENARPVLQRGLVVPAAAIVGWVLLWTTALVKARDLGWGEVCFALFGLGLGLWYLFAAALSASALVRLRVVDDVVTVEMRTLLRRVEEECAREKLGKPEIDCELEEGDTTVPGRYFLRVLVGDRYVEILRGYPREDLEWARQCLTNWLSARRAG
jgi:hypothetical protein